MHSLKQLGIVSVLVLILLFTNSAMAQRPQVRYNDNCAGCHSVEGGSAPTVSEQNEAAWRERLIPGGIRQLQRNIRLGLDENDVRLNHSVCPGNYPDFSNDNQCHQVIGWMLRQSGIPTAPDEAALYSLELEGIDFDFDAGTTMYSINVGNDVVNTRVIAAPDSAVAFITRLSVRGSSGRTADNTFDINSGITLTTGLNEVRVEVTSEDQSDIQFYDMNIVRALPPMPLTITASVRVFLEGILNDE